VTEPERQTVIERASHRCEYCQSQMRYATQRFSVEHIQPKAKGGTDDLENLALSCQGCNNHKFTRTEARDAATGLLAPIYHPRAQTFYPGDRFDPNRTRQRGRPATQPRRRGEPASGLTCVGRAPTGDGLNAHNSTPSSGPELEHQMHGSNNSRLPDGAEQRTRVQSLTRQAKALAYRVRMVLEPEEGR
jgi:HNH endonuclease